MNKLLFFAVLFFVQPVFSAPYFWSIKTKGKTVYLLGTSHYGVAVEDLSCPDSSNKVKDSVLNSDLVFVEDLETLYISPDFSIDELRVIYTGSEKEKEQLFEEHSISQERRNRIERANRIAFEARNKMRPTLYVDEEKESPENLSPKVQEFLRDQEIDMREDFSSIYQSIDFLIDKKARYSIGKLMDGQINRLALENEIPVFALENRDIISNELQNMTDNRTKEEINGSDIEELLNLSIEDRQSKIKQSADQYLRGEIYPIQFPEELHNIILKNRNQMWVNKILTALENPEYENIFVAGGLAHFTSRDNVLDMLEEEGLFAQRIICKGFKPAPVSIKPHGKKTKASPSD